MENQKKLQRDKQNKVIGGVCSGMANYFGIDAALIRLLFVVAFLFFSTGFWIYVILWIVMPAGDITRHQADYVVSSDGTVETNPENTKSVVKQPTLNKGSLVAGLVLICIGALGLLNMYFPEFNWRTAWPILLIALGLFLIIPFNRKQL